MAKGWIVPDEWFPVPSFKSADDEVAVAVWGGSDTIDVPDDLLAEVEATKKAFNAALTKLADCHERVYPPDEPKHKWQGWEPD